MQKCPVSVSKMVQWAWLPYMTVLSDLTNYLNFAVPGKKILIKKWKKCILTLLWVKIFKKSTTSSTNSLSTTRTNWTCSYVHVQIKIINLVISLISSLEILPTVKTSYDCRIVPIYSVSKPVPLTSASCIFVLTLLFCADLPEALALGTVCVPLLSSVAFSASPFASWNSEGCSPIPGPF